jgi:hypothetical protein
MDKTYFMPFKTKNSYDINYLFNSGNMNVTSRYNIKFLDLTLDNQLNWKAHIDILYSKLSTSSYTIRILKQTLSQDILLMSYFTYFHSIMSYGIILGGNSSYANKTFKLQKKVIIIIEGVRNRDSCHKSFKNLKILTLVSQYIFSLLIFILDNRDDYICNYDIHKRNTTQGTNLHQPMVSLSLYQKSFLNMGTKVFNNLPSSIKESHIIPDKFKLLLKNFLYSNTFYTLDEYFNYKLT